MKKVDCNFVITIAAAAFILVGICSSKFVAYFEESVYLLLTADTPIEVKIENFINDIETNSSENLNYSSLCMDIQSTINRMIDRRSVKKGDLTIVRLDSGYLAYSEPRVDDEILRNRADECAKLNQSAAELNIPFLYVMAPEKGENARLPAGTENCIKINCDRFAELLRERDVNLLDLRQKKTEQNITDEEMFFVTDHHWKPEMGLWALDEICQKLQTDYGFNYDTGIADLSNYNVKTYEKWFLGSQGKTAGKNFTELPVDNIDLITPKFHTMLRTSQPMYNKTQVGSFEETVIDMSAIEKRDLYEKRSYAAYTGGDFSLQIIENLLAPESACDFVVIRDSFASVVTPFLALTSKTVHTIDLREYDYKRVESVSQYIRDVKPDYVIVLYTGVAQGDAKKFDFR